MLSVLLAGWQAVWPAGALTRALLAGGAVLLLVLALFAAGYRSGFAQRDQAARAEALAAREVRLAQENRYQSLLAAHAQTLAGQDVARARLQAQLAEEVKTYAQNHVAVQLPAAARRLHDRAAAAVATAAPATGTPVATVADAQAPAAAGVSDGELMATVADNYARCAELYQVAAGWQAWWRDVAATP
ncbi:hypothetical protein SAMN02745857_02792 [Andreprevotia lacus DSM 23236]|uniref:Bacteriophage Rz lysis protein n=1 Tax=Andreprevotia lacus DSM 23236 TaxID=1121001 RepID=A0A1W1XTK2_9NEIS|nr:hypothetical protein [Andreprevotia lacus]SMC27293.1 hypothetical protein SAMN02745857_02792 [Andreprevotia lacus DSM 23236]